jgi:hypothetical protein
MSSGSELNYHNVIEEMYHIDLLWDYIHANGGPPSNEGETKKLDQKIQDRSKHLIAIYDRMGEHQMFRGLLQALLISIDDGNNRWRESAFQFDQRFRDRYMRGRICDVEEMVISVIKVLKAQAEREYKLLKLEKIQLEKKVNKQ